MTSKTIVIAGFPGVGKSHAKRVLDGSGYVVSDSDSSHHSKNGFPDNYIQHIQSLIDAGEHDFIFVSSHDVVRMELQERNIDYVLVYPDKSLKAEYLRRYTERGSAGAFIDLLDENWDAWISQIEKERFPKLLRLNSPEDTMLHVVTSTYFK